MFGLNIIGRRGRAGFPLAGLRTRQSRGYWFYPPAQVLSLLKNTSLALSDRTLNQKASVYIQIPFCRSICDYCLFGPTLRVAEAENVRKYLEGLEREIDIYAAAPYVNGLEIDSVYFGGGTPTCLEIYQLERLIKKVRKNFRLTEKAQITVEGNSSTYDREKIFALKQAGVDRISIGVQTFDPVIKKYLSLPHDTESVERVFRNTAEAGIRTVNLDLIYGLPGETERVWEKDLKAAIGLAPSHITVYSLIMNPRSRLFLRIKRKEVPGIPGERSITRMYSQALSFLRRRGYEQESLVDFVKPSAPRFRYSLSGGGLNDILALGSRSTGYLNGCTYTNFSGISQYLDSLGRETPPVAYAVRNESEEQMRRYMVLGLRLLSLDGILFKKKYGVSFFDVFPHEIDFLRKRRLIVKTGSGISLTRKGKIKGGEVSAVFFSSEVKKAMRSFCRSNLPQTH